MECKECGDTITYGNLCPACVGKLRRCTYCERNPPWDPWFTACRECMTERYGLHECGNPLDDHGDCLMCSD